MGTRKPRLLIVGPLPPPVGGVETVTKAVLESTVFEQHETSHCDLTKKRPKEKAGRFDLGNFYWAMIHFARMTHSIATFRPDVVYMPLTATWSGFWRDSVLAWIAKRGGAKILGHVHGGWFDRILIPRGVHGKLVRVCLEQFDSLLLLGRKWKDLVIEYKFIGKVLVVPPTLRRELYDVGMSYQRDYRATEPLGLYVGHVGRGKGVLDLLDALHVLKRSGKPAKMVFVGPPQDDGDWEEVIGRRAELGLEDVTQFVGPLWGEELYEKYRQADYFVLPSYYEGLPVVFLEAGAFGLPVIGTPVGAIPDLLVHEQNALLVAPGATADLASAIDRIRMSESDRRCFGERLRQTVKSYHPDRICERILEAITVTHGDSGKSGAAREPLY